MRPISIIYIDPNTPFRQLVTRLIARHWSYEIVVRAEAPAWPLLHALDRPPQAILIGLGSEALLDPATINALQADLPNVPIVALSHFAEPAYRRAALQAGAHAFIAKESLLSELLPVLQQLLDPTH